MALIETSCRVALAAIAAAVLALPATAGESRRNHSSGVNGQPTRPSAAPAPQVVAPHRGTPPSTPTYSYGSRPPSYHGGYYSGWVPPRPFYNPPLVVYPAPRIAYIPPPVIYSPPPRYYVESAPVYVTPQPTYVQPSVPQAMVIPPNATVPPEQPVWYYCADYREYYPNVEQCPSNWLRVLPDASAQQQPQQ